MEKPIFFAFESVLLQGVADKAGKKTWGRMRETERTLKDPKRNRISHGRR
jgi:hypothetical protein